MNELIKISKTTINNENFNSVNARDLWLFLESKQKFSDWIKNRIEKYEFIENKDYIVNHKIMKDNIGENKKVIDYIITLDTAKELAMVENNEKGREVRRYFIEHENTKDENIKEILSKIIICKDYCREIGESLSSYEKNNNLEIMDNKELEGIINILNSKLLKLICI